jgi:Arc/MetJ-type ribon-helix-helix transcriptional regulator
MNINLTPEQEQIVNNEVKSGHFRSAEEVIAQALVALREKERSSSAGSPAGDSNGGYDAEVREMLDFVEKNRTPLQGISVKQLIREGQRL